MTMKSKKLGIITLFLLAPLVTANSPAPAVSANEYNDFSISFVKKAPVSNGDGSLFEYFYDVTNTGSGYLENITFMKDNRGEGYAYISDDFFGSTLLAPEKTTQFSFYASSDFDGNSEEVTTKGTGYSEFLENPFKNNEFTIKLTDTYEDNHGIPYTFVYNIGADFNFDINESDYRFGAIVNVTYNSEEKVIFTRNLYSENQIEFYINSNTPLDLDNFAIDSILIIKTEYHSPYQFLNDALKVMEVVAIVFVAITMGGGFLFICIFFPIREVKKRKKLKEQKGQ